MLPPPPMMSNRYAPSTLELKVISPVPAPEFNVLAAVKLTGALNVIELLVVAIDPPK